ncbi:hypothetical protein MKX03_032347 [Papaver bracteatum]|nr:hypothetical protein MKX03_032347 [Papaver bracteatum]
MGEGVGGDQESDYDLRKATSKAASKLNNLDSKYDLLKKTKCVLDLCPGSGGWMHVAVLKIQQGGLVVGVGLHPIKPIPDAILIQEDITAPECRDTIRTHMTENGFTGFDLVMRGGGGGLSSDTGATPWDQAYQLTESIKLATEFLSPEGAFVAKMFDGAQDYSPMLYCLQQLFGSVAVTKPTFTFPETYIVAKKDINPEVRYSSGRASTRYHGTTVAGIIVEGIDRGIVVRSDGLVICGGTRTEDDIKVEEIGRDMSCGLCGDFDFTETLYRYIDDKVWDKIVSKESRPSVEKCARMVERWYASYWKQCVKKGDEVDQAFGKQVGNDNHAYLAMAAYEDEGMLEGFLKENIKKCTSIAATVDVMKKMFLKSARYDSRTGGTFKISVIRPHKDIKALRRLPPHKRNTGSIIDESITLSDLMIAYNDNFNDRLMDQEYGLD